MIRLFCILSIMFSSSLSSQTSEIVKKINEISKKCVEIPMTRYDNSIVYINDVEFGQTKYGYYCNYNIGESKNKLLRLKQQIINFNSIQNISISKKNTENSKVKLLQITFNKSVVFQNFNNKEDSVAIFAIPFLNSEEDYKLLVNYIKKLKQEE